ncbi:MAG: segregation and condensation protein A [Thermogutta sp.]
MMEFRVQLDVFRGPLDLLLYLVRRHEVAVTEISVAVIAEQFLRFLEGLDSLDVDMAADYLAMASWLAELKSYELLPHAEDIPENELPAEPRQELVRRLLEYKRYRDLACVLEERAKEWQKQYRRLSDDLGSRIRDPADEPLEDVHLWDLVNAFVRVLQENELQTGRTLIYDDTPIQVFMERIYRQLLERQHIAMSELFYPGMHKSTLVGVFMACLELVRFGFARIEQHALFDEIHLFLREDRPNHLPWGESLEEVRNSEPPVEENETDSELALTSEPAIQPPGQGINDQRQ